MKALLSLFSVGLCVAAFAAGTNTVMDAEARKAFLERKYYENTGGRIMNPNSGSGKIVFVNAQKAISRESVVESVRELSLVFAVKMEVADGTATAVDGFDEAAKKSGGDATIFVVNDPKLPLSLVAYESGWGALNAAKLPEDKGNVLAGSRFRKALARVFALTCGIGSGSGAAGLMAPVRKAAELDFCVLPDRPNPIMVGAIHKYLSNFGVQPVQVATYRNACRQGWAPAPTNDVQKALWEKAKAQKEKGPTHPILIKPPEKKK